MANNKDPKPENTFYRPSLAEDQSLASLVDSHSGGVPPHGHFRATAYYAALFGDRLIGRLDRAVAALEQLAKGVEAVAHLAKGVEALGRLVESQARSQPPAASSPGHGG